LKESDFSVNDLFTYHHFINIFNNKGEKVVSIKTVDDINFYNYAAFSYCGNYFCYVARRNMSGIAHLFKIDFVKGIVLADYHLYASKAVWICGFSKDGYLGYYDSVPNARIVPLSQFNRADKKVSNGTPVNAGERLDGKSFFCFSPNSSFVALSEQGYDALTLGGNGHQKSTALHIYQKNPLEPKFTFDDHGDRIGYDTRRKENLSFVAFSMDERRLMSISNDGVVVVRNLEI
jgi:hypothetical protein